MWQLKNKLEGLRFKMNTRVFADRVTLIVVVAAVLTLGWLVYLNVRPIPTVDIKVPVATDQSSYYPGQQVSGIFFGDVFYEGKVEVLREVYCKDFNGIIKTSEGDDIFKGISRATHLEGTSREIGELPKDVPVGSNCVIQFANTYNIPTPFGNRTITKIYYTQNFAIVSYGRKLQSICESQGGEDCDKLNDSNSSTNPAATPPVPTTQNTNRDAPLYQPESQDSSTGTGGASSTTNNTTNNSTTNNTTNNPAAVNPPADRPKVCTAKILFICVSTE